MAEMRTGDPAGTLLIISFGDLLRLCALLHWVSGALSWSFAQLLLVFMQPCVTMTCWNSDSLPASVVTITIGCQECLSERTSAEQHAQIASQVCPPLCGVEHVSMHHCSLPCTGAALPALQIERRVPMLLCSCKAVACFLNGEGPRFTISPSLGARATSAFSMHVSPLSIYTARLYCQ